MGILDLLIRRRSKEELARSRQEWLTQCLATYQEFNALVDRFSKMHAANQAIAWEDVSQASEGFAAILKAVNEMPKPHQRDLREIRKDFRLTLHWWIKVGGIARDIVSEEKAGRASPSRAYTNQAMTYTGYAAKRHKALVDRLRKAGLDPNALAGKKPRI